MYPPIGYSIQSGHSKSRIQHTHTHTKTVRVGCISIFLNAFRDV